MKAKCGYCYREVDEVLSKPIEIRGHYCGKIFWSKTGRVCQRCRDYLRGVFRYQKETK